MMQSRKNTIHKLLTKTATNTRQKISTCFEIEHKNKLDHQHDLVYDAKCPSELCDKSYIDESYIAERVNDHNGREYKSQIIKH